jgi:ABC-type antimicrobial peptide transport system permease subunit
VVALFSMSEITISALEGAVDQDKLAMLRSYVTLKSERSAVAFDYLAALNTLPDIEQVQAVAHYPVYWKRPDEGTFAEGRLFGYSTPLPDMALEPIELIAGRWPVAGQNEIVVERRFASAHRVKMGDTLTLRVLTPAADSPTHEEAWTVVGTVFEPYLYPTLPGAPTQIPTSDMIFGELADVQYISGRAGVNLIQARYVDFPTAEAQKAAFEAAITDQTPYAPSVTLVEDPARNSLIEQTRIFSNVLSLLAVVALIVSGFLVLNVINATVIEQRRQIGVMKSLGATGADNFMMYAGVALVYGIIGVVPGVLLGVPTGFAAAKNIAPQFNIFLDKFDYSPLAILIGALLGVLVPVASSALPVMLGVRVTILEAITDLGINARYGGGPFARLLEILPLPLNLRQSFRNVSQKKGRLALTIITLALAAGAFMGVYAALSTFNAFLESTLGQVGIQISVGLDRSHRFEDVRDLIRTRVDGIKAVEPGTVLAIDIPGHQQRRIGPGPAFLIASGINPDNRDIVRFQLRSGRAWQDDPSLEGVVIAAPIADGMKLDTGDTITLQVGGATVTLPVIGVSTYSFDTVWMRWDQLSRLGGLTSGVAPNQYVTTVNLDGQPVIALGVDERARALIPFQAGGFVAPGEPGVMVSEALATRGGYAVGDTVTLASGANRVTVPIAGIFAIPPQLAQPDQPDEAIMLFWKDLAALEGAPIEGEPVPSSLQILLDQKDPSAEFVSAKIDEINTLLLANGINTTYTNWVASTEGVAQILQTASIVLNTAAALIAAVGVIGLLSTLSMSVFERQKEIGVMRSVGATSYSVAFLFLVEGLIVGVIGWALGVPFSYALDRTLISEFNFQNTPEAAYPPLTLLYGLSGMLVIATLASLWPSIAAARKTVSNILRYQ